MTTKRENRTVITFVLFNILQYVNMADIVKYLNDEQYTLPGF